MSLSDENWAIFSRIGFDHYGDHRDYIEALMNAVRQEERARAVEVVKPFLVVSEHLADKVWDEDDATLDYVIDASKIPHDAFRRAAAYLDNSRKGGE